MHFFLWVGSFLSYREKPCSENLLIMIRAFAISWKSDEVISFIIILMVLFLKTGFIFSTSIFNDATLYKG